MYTDYQKIRSAIEQALNAGKSNFIIYPYGEYGAMTKQILNDSFGIKEAGIIDNHLSQFNSSWGGYYEGCAGLCRCGGRACQSNQIQIFTRTDQGTE